MTMLVKTSLSRPQVGTARRDGDVTNLETAILTSQALSYRSVGAF